MSALTDLDKTEVAKIVQAGNLNDKDVMALFCSLLLSLACGDSGQLCVRHLVYHLQRFETL